MTRPRRRRAALGFVMVTVALDMLAMGIVTPILPRLTAALSLLNAGWAALVLPESLPPERRAGFAWLHASPLGVLALLRARAGLPLPAGTSFLDFLARVSLQPVFVLETGHRCGWGQRTVGFALATIGVCTAVVGGLLVQPLRHALGERRTLLRGLA